MLETKGAWNICHGKLQALRETGSNENSCVLHIADPGGGWGQSYASLLEFRGCHHICHIPHSPLLRTELQGLMVVLLGCILALVKSFPDPLPLF